MPQPYQFLSRQPYVLGSQQFHNADIVFRVGEQGVVQMPELVLQFAVPRKKHLVDVLGIAFRCVQLLQVVRYSAQHHIALGNVVPAPVDALRIEKHFRFMQVERFKVDLAGGTIEQATFVGKQLVRYPCGCRTANDKEEVIAPGAPAVPKPLESGKKA